MIEGWSGFLYLLFGSNYFEDPAAFLIDMAYGEWNYKYDPNWQVPYSYFNGADMNMAYTIHYAYLQQEYS